MEKGETTTGSGAGATGGVSALGVLLRFAAVLGGLNLLYYVEKKLALGVWDLPYTRLVTWAAGTVATVVLPYSIDVGRTAIVAGGQNTIFIASGCNGLEAIFLIVAGVVAYPASWRQRLRGLALYVPALFGLNLGRVVGLVHVAQAHREYMDVAHFQIAQGILILFVLAFWVHYIRNVEQA